LPPLPTELRSALERAIINARDASEDAARVVLATLAFDKEHAFTSLSPEQRQLRNALRAKARQLGNGNRQDGTPMLVEEIAYSQWHRMLFARFLAENNLLMHPTGVAVTLTECEELAAEEGEPDAWQVAARYASAMLPGIFRTDDPCARVRFALEGRQALENILASLPPALFVADDALGWVYQFWQSKKKKEVNASERKIGGADISPVTQLFTEDYMVRFLLDNTLGAWWAARHPNSPLVREFAYLRFLDDGTPAAGTFPGFPERAALIRFMDPCCGSGHFDVAAFEMIRKMRMEEEGLSAVDAGDAVLRDNIFGLELDPRCTQIAAFALALAAWKSGGYRKIPIPQIACTGIAVQGQLSEWTKLAGKDVNLRTTLERLYELFKNAPDLGSLINPAELAARDRMFTADYAQVAPVLEKALAKERESEDPVAAVFGAAAEEVASATQLLAGKYTLVATNVPYLGIKKQDKTLRDYLTTQYSEGKADLATAFLQRCWFFSAEGGTCALVTPQNWMFLSSYKKLRKTILAKKSLNMISTLGEGGFESSQAAGAFVALVIDSNMPPCNTHTFVGFDSSAPRLPTEKAERLRNAGLISLTQADQHNNPDDQITFEISRSGLLLEKYATSPRGIVSGDTERWTRAFWELPTLLPPWRPMQGTVISTKEYSGREFVIDWGTGGKGMLRPGVDNVAYGRQGVAVTRMRQLHCTMYTGELYDQKTAVLVPHNQAHLGAIWAFCSSHDFREAVRRVDKRIGITPGALLKIPFDLEHWQRVAEEKGSLPEPGSHDPTQWLFDGDVATSDNILQVAVARLLGYQWHQQKADKLVELADKDGIVCLPPVAGEQPAAEHLRAFLNQAFEDGLSPDSIAQLLANAGFAGKGLDEWLRDGFFAQHCQLFHNRPFIWHIWDGRKDGFAALVNYHKLDATRLDNLIYHYLGAWITAQRADQKAGVAGADGRLVAALELQKKLQQIREGEPPYDIFVRWKSLAEQPLGWEPDLNDGVRLNIRPFVMAGVLRSKFTINWNKDRGKNPDGSERLNDLHYTRAEKAKAKK